MIRLLTQLTLAAALAGCGVAQPHDEPPAEQCETVWLIPPPSAHVPDLWPTGDAP